MAFDLSGVGIATAFAAGAISFLSPCELPLVPAYVSYIAGQTIDEHAGSRWRTLLLSLCLFGFTTIFVILGAGVNFISSALAPFRSQVTVLSGARLPRCLGTGAGGARLTSKFSAKTA